MNNPPCFDVGDIVRYKKLTKRIGSYGPFVCVTHNNPVPDGYVGMVFKIEAEIIQDKHIYHIWSFKYLKTFGPCISEELELC